MESWRRHKGEFNHQDVLGTRSNPRKPPAGNWQQRVQTVPSWEKKFCYVVGSVPWKKLVETKKYMHLYENVVKWNDSAGEEAFQDAKNRFWSEINCLPYNGSSPDPDVYIDAIDWDSKIDEALLLDLEEESVPVEGNKHGDAVMIGGPLLLDPTFSCVGWGEAEEDFKKKTDLSSGSGPTVGDGDRNENDGKNPWESSCPRVNGNIKGLEENSWGHSGWDSVNNKGTWESNNSWSREAGGSNMSRYKTTRYHGDDHRGSGGRRVSFGCEQPFSERRSSRQWEARYCRPVSHGVPEKAGNSWGW